MTQRKLNVLLSKDTQCLAWGQIAYVTNVLRDLLAETCVVYSVTLETKNETNFKDFLLFFLYQSSEQVIILICKYQPREFFLHHYLLITDLAK